MIPMWLGAKAL